MDLAVLSNHAVALRQRFDEVARLAGRREWTNDEIMQGFVVDVGALMKLVMAKNGIRVVPDADQKLAHELADCLWSVLVLAKSHDVDLEAEFLRMIGQVSASLQRGETPKETLRASGPAP